MGLLSANLKTWSCVGRQLARPSAAGCYAPPARTPPPAPCVGRAGWLARLHYTNLARLLLLFTVARAK
eukprot:742834-Pleurochrysis_carterae.AAC.1